MKQVRSTGKLKLRYADRVHDVPYKRLVQRVATRCGRETQYILSLRATYIAQNKVCVSKAHALLLMHDCLVQLLRRCMHHGVHFREGLLR